MQLKFALKAAEKLLLFNNFNNRMQFAVSCAPVWVCICVLILRHVFRLNKEQ